MKIERHKKLDSKKPIKRNGTEAKKWYLFRKKWLKDNPPDDNGYYICRICQRPVSQDEVTLDHIKPRSTHPHLRYDVNNVRPAHLFCNSEKGSKYSKALNREYGRYKRDNDIRKASSS